MSFYVVRERESPYCNWCRVTYGFHAQQSSEESPPRTSHPFHSLSCIHVQSSTCRCIFLMDNHPTIYFDNDTIIIGKTFPFDRQILSINVLDSHTKVNESVMKQ